METDRERTVVGWPPYLGGWWTDEGASKKDILSGLVRVWPVLRDMSLLAHRTQKHTLLTPSHITLLFRSPSVSHQWPNPGRKWETHRQTLGYLSSARTVASYREKQNKGTDRTTVGAATFSEFWWGIVAFTTVRVWQSGEEKINFFWK